ncbi:MAG TPA: prepilin-type N-terminal cleavage/methylation domain-containing protein [Gammaproteobacteria bacterium]|nr:prepilin-type N-terminal cleavage/methylation domain-containing protein [Gammaproteobacteria bacterium]
MSSLPRKQSGVTLIELVVSIVVISIALVGVLLALNRSISTSADPMVQQQAVSIGEAYIEEIIGKSYAPLPNPAGRQNYNDVDDYNGLNDIGARDQTNTAIAALNAYTVGVDVDDGANLNGAPAKLVTVTVSHAGMPDVALAAYRLDY